MTTESLDYAFVSSSTNALTITLASLATSSTFSTGNYSDIIDNTSNLYTEVMVMGQITTGTTPTNATSVIVSAYAPTKNVSGTYSYPVAGTTMLTESATSGAAFDVNQLTGLQRGASWIVNSTSDRAYTFSFAISPLFGGIVPPKFGIFVAHGTGVNLNATAGNHWIHWLGIKRTFA